MKIAIALLAFTAVSALGMSQKPKVTVRFHAETNPNDTSTFSMPAKLMYAQRAATLGRVPVLSERDIKAIFPFKTTDGSYGCVFQFDEQGRIRLEQVSSSQQGTALVTYVATKAGQHQVADMLVDRPVTNGRITVPRGLTEIEVSVMKKQFKVLGEESPKDKKEREKREEEQKKKEAQLTEGFIDRKRDTTQPPAAPGPLPVDSRRKTVPPADARGLRDLDLPRVGD
jgi:hypothetical protein